MTITTGYKATDKDMKCRELQFVLGEWQEVDGELVECRNGLHFCTELAHTYEFYNSSTDRRFECEVEDVLEIEYQPGVLEKRVARRIKLTKELAVSGSSNTGNWNTGNSNTGNSNTGNWNTGSSNTGYSNTGNWNTGSSNTGYSNTGNWNTGSSNTGNSNTGSRNTGSRNTGSSNTGSRNTGSRNTGSSNTGNSNTGSSNTGYRNTGSSNTGDWNHCDRSAGFFGSIEPKVTSFDKISEYSYSEYQEKFGDLVYRLGQLMLQHNDRINVTPFLEIPNISQEKLDNLHQKFIESRIKLTE